MEIRSAGPAALQSVQTGMQLLVLIDSCCCFYLGGF